MTRGMRLPQGVFLVVILSVLVGILTGPFTFSSLSLAPLIRSWHTFSRDFTFLDNGNITIVSKKELSSHLEVRVILILWTGASSSTPFPSWQEKNEIQISCSMHTTKFLHFINTIRNQGFNQESWDWL